MNKTKTNLLTCNQKMCVFQKKGCKPCKECKAEPNMVSETCETCFKCEYKAGFCRWGDNNPTDTDVKEINKPMEIIAK